MDHGSRHRFIASPGTGSFVVGGSPAATYTRIRNSSGVPSKVEAGVVYFLHGEQAQAHSPERLEPGAVADQRRSAPVGEPSPLDQLVALRGPRRLPDLGQRSGLVAVDNPQSLRGLTRALVLLGLVVASWGIVAAVVLLALH